MVNIKPAGLFIGLLVLLSSPSYSARFSVLPGDDLIGNPAKIIITKKGDTFSSLAREYELSVHELKEANPSITKLQASQKILLPTEFILPEAKYRNGIVVDMPELRLYFFRPDGKTVDTYPVAMGRAGWRTPLMQTTVVSKKARPSWHVPPRIHDYMYEMHGIDLPAIVPPGPRNPLGPYALYLGESGYLIHGNNQAKSIGTYASSGCIRMYNKDITELYAQVSLKTPVYVINLPYKAGWKQNALFFKAQQIVDHPVSNKTTANPHAIIAEVTRTRPTPINLDKVNAITTQPTGMIEQINQGIAIH